ncbi:MAG: hypothetical protein ACT4P2_03440 [Pseudomonadota bacterium]
MRPLALTAVLLLVGACPAAPPPRSLAPRLALALADDGTAIEVVAVDRLGLTAAELIGPGGQRSRAGPIEREPVRAPALPTPAGVGVGVAGGSRGIDVSGVIIELPIGGTASPPPTLVRSRARFSVPDLAAYRRDWRSLVVRLTFGLAPGEVKRAELPAPQPD